MPRPMSFDRVCCPRAVMHATPYIADRVCCPREVMSCQGRRCRLCVLSKMNDVIPRPMSSDRACIQRVVMSCHT